jgi:hypothetical protein
LNLDRRRALEIERLRLGCTLVATHVLAFALAGAFLCGTCLTGITATTTATTA